MCGEKIHCTELHTLKTSLAPWCKIVHIRDLIIFHCLVHLEPRSEGTYVLSPCSQPIFNHLFYCTKPSRGFPDQKSRPYRICARWKVSLNLPLKASPQDATSFSEPKGTFSFSQELLERPICSCISPSGIRTVLETYTISSNNGWYFSHILWMHDTIFNNILYV